MGSVRAAVLEFLSGGEGTDSSAPDAAQAAQQRAFVRGLLPGIGHQGPIPSQAPAPPPSPPQPDGDPAGVLVWLKMSLPCLHWLWGLVARGVVPGGTGCMDCLLPPHLGLLSLAEGADLGAPHEQQECANDSMRFHRTGLVGWHWQDPDGARLLPAVMGAWTETVSPTDNQQGTEC